MSFLEERESAEETKFQLNADLEFKAKSRSTARLARWSASVLRKPEDEHEAYVAKIVSASVTSADGALNTVAADLVGVVPHDEVLRKAKELLDAARTEIRNNG